MAKTRGLERFLFVTLLIAFPLASSSCSEEEITPPLLGPEEYPIDTFPRAQGDHWTYALSETAWGNDPTPARRCTLDVSVAGEDTVDGLGPVSTWLLECGEDRDTLYLSVAGDTVQFHPVPGSHPANYVLPGLLPFPLHVGKTWRTTLTVSEVDTMAPVCTPAGAFDALRIDTENRSIGNAAIGYDADFAPGVGIVHLDEFAIFTIGFSAWKRQLTLLDYAVHGTSGRARSGSPPGR